MRGIYKYFHKEIYKLMHGLAGKIMQELFPLRQTHYNIRACNIFKTSNAKSAQKLYLPEAWRRGLLFPYSDTKPTLS